MPELAGDDLAIVLFSASVAIGLGLETMKAETPTRKVIFGFLTAVFLSNTVFWMQIKTVWPSLSMPAVSISTSPIAWFVVFMFILAVIAFHPAKARDRVDVRPSLPTVVVADASKTDVPSNDRVVVDVTVEHLIGIYRGRTTIQADALAAKYLGKWTTIGGTVANVWKSNSDYRMILVAGDYDKLVTLNFGENSHVGFITKGSEVAAHGKIVNISATGVDMEDCRLAE